LEKTGILSNKSLDLKVLIRSYNILLGLEKL